MKRVFTEYVRALAHTPEPSPSAFEELWTGLREALVGALRRHGLWQGPPSFLGVFGYRSWRSPGPSQGDALDELVAACYEFTFITRLGSLLDHLASKENIDGLVFLNIRHFLFERQRRYDPVGYRVYRLLRSALRQEVEEGGLAVVEGDPRINNRTVLSWAGAGGGEVCERSRLARIVGDWCPQLLADLATARQALGAGAKRALSRQIHQLREAAVAAFRFKDLVDPLKGRGRDRWAALLEQEVTGWEAVGRKPGFGDIVRRAAPDGRLEERESFREFQLRMEDLLEAHPGTAREREYLARLWRFLVRHAQGTAPPPADPLPSTPDSLPSRRKIAACLDIPRNRLPELYSTLRSLAERSREGPLLRRAAGGPEPTDHREGMGFP